MAQSNTIVVVNAGSSSIKFSLFGENGADPSVFLKGQIEGLYTDGTHFAAHDVAGELVAEKRWNGAATHDDAMRHLLDFVRTHLGDHRVEAVGHRIVHGGTDYAAPIRLDAEALARLDRLVPLAPLHQPHNLAPVRTVLDVAPHLVQVGCFDTAFHSAQPSLAQAFALPAEITDRGVRRYGFHGLSYEYIASVLPELDPSLAQARVILAHLGDRASLFALHAGRSVASTRGFAPGGGVATGSRGGTPDPGAIRYRLPRRKAGPPAAERLSSR